MSISVAGGKLRRSSGLVFKLLLTLNPSQHEHYLCVIIFFFFSCVSVLNIECTDKTLYPQSKSRLHTELKFTPSVVTDVKDGSRREM